jgi:N-acetylglucosaminyldiphosphoundecaprenol N-acetyl-beta-D-mannosaminyltransferase
LDYYFKLKFEFNHYRLRHKVNASICKKETGYVCVIDANVLTMAQKNTDYRQVLNQAMVNTCDGSSIAFFAGLIHGKRLRAYNGPEIFEYYIEQTQYKQVLLGNTLETISEINKKLLSQNRQNSHLHHVSIPFVSVEDFNYPDIADHLNGLAPDIIWVSLGAPKQEIFMSNILPHLKQGVMFGIGAAFNFYTGKLHLPRFNFFGLRLIWLNRFIREPRKLSLRLLNYIKILPFLILSEMIKINFKNTSK